MNSISIRHFFVIEGDKILRVSNAKFSRLLKGASDEKTENFAGKRIRTAEIVVELLNRKPVKVIRANYFYLHFDKKGIVDYDRFISDGSIVANAGLPLLFSEKEENNIINAEQEFYKRRRDHAVWWKPNMLLERNILDAAIDDFKCKRL